MNQELMRFPIDWPNECPPNDAVPAEGTVYRLVKNNPCEQNDFRSHRELGKLPNADPCLRCGLSVFRDIADAKHQHCAYPKLGNFIARANVNATHGRTKLTQGQQPSHTTWWPHEDIERHTLFTHLEEIQ